MNKIIILLFIIFGNISISIADNNFYEIEAERVKYKDQKKTIIAEGNAFARNSFNKKIYADKIIYFKDKNIIKTFGNSRYEDGVNYLTADNFFYDLKSKIIEANRNVTLINENNDKFYFSKFKYYESRKKGFGENIVSKFSDGSYMKSQSGFFNNKNKITKLKNVIYTTCSKITNKNNKICPSWSLKSNNVIHDKKKKIIIHKNAFLRIKNIPILYAPYISHPDPTVKRKNGFLPPTIKTLNDQGKTLKIPYFWAISEDKDITIKPIIYFNEHDAIQTSYRQAFKNGFLQIENGYSKGYKKLNPNRTNGSRNFFFADYQGNLDNIIYKNNDLKFKIQRVSQKNYLRVNKINTKLFKEDITSLQNSFEISSYKDNKKLDLKIGVFENLAANDSEKYTYFFPDGSYSQNFNSYKNFNINLNTFFQGKKFLDNQRQGKVRNFINISSKDLIYKSIGINTILKTNIYNNNIYNRNVVGEKENLNVDNYATTAIENSWPLIKLGKNRTEIIIPKLFSKYTSGKMQNTSSDQVTFQYPDIFSMNRTNNLDKPETGFSFGHGIEYSNTKYKNADYIKSTQYKLSTGFGQVIKKNEKPFMPTSSSLDNKSSDFVGFTKFKIFGKEQNMPNNENQDSVNYRDLSFSKFFNKDNLEINYDFNLNNDLSKLHRNNFNLKGSYKNFFINFIFDEKNMHTGNTRSSDWEINTRFNENYYFSISGKKNLKTNASEYHKLSINFENDCLVSFLSLSRDFYSDQDISPSKTLIFGVTIKPFSDNFAPDLSDFIN